MELMAKMSLSINYLIFFKHNMRYKIHNCSEKTYLRLNPEYFNASFRLNRFVGVTMTTYPSIMVEVDPSRPKHDSTEN